MLLKDCESLTVQTIEELENLLVTVASGRILQAVPLNNQPRFRCRSQHGQAASLFYLTSSFSSSFDFEPVDYHRFVFHLEKPAEIYVGSSSYSIDLRQASYVLPIGQTVREAHPEGYKSLALRLCPEKLRLVASRLLDRPVDCPIVFEQPDQLDFPFNDYIRTAAITAAREVNEIAQPFHAAYWEAFEASISIRLLQHSRHSLSHLFKAQQRSGGRLGRVEEHIRAHWNERIQLDTLAEVAGTSAKTVYTDFIRRYGETPHDYIKRLRLEKAHDMLKQDPAPSAMMVALRCGFTSFGHFARAYRMMFGELPSATARRKRS